jgi:hypothetical protein
LLGLVAVLALPIWAWRHFRWSIFKFGFLRGGQRREDPVRREAGRWLERLRERSDDWRVTSDELTAAQMDLQRLRFGASATWPEPENVFRRARRAMRESRRVTAS